MIKWFTGKNNVLPIIFILLAASAVLLLPSSLESASLHRGVDVRLPEELVETNQGLTVVGLSDISDQSGNIYRFLTRVFFWGIIPLILIIYLASPGDRKKKLLYLAIALSLIILVPMIVQSMLQGVEPQPLEEEVVILPTPQPDFEVNQPEVSSTPVAPILGVIFSALVVIPIVIYLAILYHRHISDDTDSLVISQQADRAISALKDGQAMGNVIIQLYQDMCTFLDRKRGIQRKSHLTPREFQAKLISIGVPDEASSTLTRFFEAARYGNSSFDDNEQDQAIQCLTVIKESVSRVENPEPAN